MRCRLLDKSLFHSTKETEAAHAFIIQVIQWILYIARYTVDPLFSGRPRSDRMILRSGRYRRFDICITLKGQEKGLYILICSFNCISGALRGKRSTFLAYGSDGWRH